MNGYEKVYKLAVELLLFLFCLLFFHRMGTPSGPFPLISLSIIAAHSMMWLLNGQAMTMIIHMGLLPTRPKRFIAYTDRLARSIASTSYVGGAAAFGSMTRCAFKETSDIDVRLIMKESISARIRICHFCFVERARAFFYRYPIDIFAFPIDEMKEKMDPQETPVILHDPIGKLTSLYPEALPYEQFSATFRKKFLGQAG